MNVISLNRCCIITVTHLALKVIVIRAIYRYSYISSQENMIDFNSRKVNFGHDILAFGSFLRNPNLRHPFLAEFLLFCSSFPGRISLLFIQFQSPFYTCLLLICCLSNHVRYHRNQSYFGDYHDEEHGRFSHCNRRFAKHSTNLAIEGEELF